ncbi:helicase associated domain-containing protein [Amycolatopsis sp. RTGN1]|uniref:helicase associated domain-containing protein n=1 Tax=Amycolatopsis ponsaeliensis TaxID=2992142 RepID=UPI00254FAE6E|nr:hypothetical protein [Amycolatopsis sp. RTGN1]
MSFPFNRVQTAIERFTAQGAIDLRRRGVTPLLGVLISYADDSFLAEVISAAHAAGVDVRCLDLDSQAQDNHRLPLQVQRELDTLGSAWEWDAGHARMESGLQAMLTHQMDAELTQFLALHGHSQPPCGYRAPGPAEHGLALGAWVHKQRVGRVAGALAALTEDESVHGVICPPPLSHGLSLRSDIAPYLPVEKDVDGVHPTSLATLLPFPELSLDEVVLTQTATAALAPDPVRRLACALLVMATVAAAQRQHPHALTAG